MNEAFIFVVATPFSLIQSKGRTGTELYIYCLASTGVRPWATGADWQR